MSPAEFTLMLNSSPSVDWDSSYDEKCLNVAASRALVTLTYPPYRRHKIYSNTYVQTMQEMRTLLLTMPTLINNYVPVRSLAKLSKYYHFLLLSIQKYTGFPQVLRKNSAAFPGPFPVFQGHICMFGGLVSHLKIVRLYLFLSRLC